MINYESVIQRIDASVTALNSRIMDVSYCSIDQDATRVLLDCADILGGYARGFQDELVSFIASELYEFQEATGCDTAVQFKEKQLVSNKQTTNPVTYRKKKSSANVWHIFHQANGRKH